MNQKNTDSTRWPKSRLEGSHGRGYIICATMHNFHRMGVAYNTLQRATGVVYLGHIQRLVFDIADNTISDGQYYKLR